MSQPSVCLTCGKPDYNPYRVYDDRGKVRHGCVDACHTGRLVTPSESSRWHHSAQAKRIRAAGKYALKHGYTAAVDKYFRKG